MAVITNESKDSLENRTNVQLENLSQLELENQEQEIYFNFFNSLKSPVTKVTYDGHIKTYLKFCNFTKLSELLTIPDPQKQIIKYITSLKDRGLSYNSIHTMLYGIYHFYIMNDVIVNKEKINKFIGEPTLTILDKPYTHEQIKKILDVSDSRMKCIVLLMASGGLRVGAITSLKLRNLERIEQCYKITVYEGSKEQYITFVTPECSSFIDSYLEYRAKSGEKLTENSFLIREQFDITDQEQIRKGKGIQTGTLKVMLNLLLVKAGIREVNHTNPHKRHEVARAHGYRKFHSNQLRKAKVQSECRWSLEGHKLLNNDPNYQRIEIEELYTEFQKAIDLLTIDPSNRLLKQVKILEVEKSRLDLLELSLKRLEQKYKSK